MHSIHEMKFRRRFSINPYKTLRMKLGEMSCFKNWVDDRRGDPYPVLESTETDEKRMSETLPDARYRAENHTSGPLMKARLLGQHFPYATYDVEMDEVASDGVSGMGVRIAASGEEGSDYDRTNEPTLYILASVCEGHINIHKTTKVGGGVQQMETVNTGIAFTPGSRLIVTCRGRFFDVYLRPGNLPEYVCTFEVPEMQYILRYDTFVRSTASLLVSAAPGAAVQGAVEFYLEGGVSHADMKCMHYENGMPIMKDGRLFMTISVRLQEGGYQMICSWNPSTADIRMEGALFFDLGDGYWCSDIASTVVYNRKTDEWYVWACAFSHGHILCHAVSYADLRYGIHVLDAERMPVEFYEAPAGEDSLSKTSGGASESGRPAVSDDRLFFGKAGDEDPDLVYDEEKGKWQLIFCRNTKDGGETQYRYYLFESDDPFEGFEFIDRTVKGSNTGGSIIRVGGEKYLLCGSDFNQRAKYLLHPLNDLSKRTEIRFDYDDGGFRGWGCLIPVPCGRRTRYVWMTFDRHNGSSYNWSYGNIHVFEADRMNYGWEWHDKPGLIGRGI
ncbi:MAG: hypothetical protein IJE08_02775 [Clostridia bacterium]|nr:hypothetical protein [Clostridia bacterium]